MSRAELKSLSKQQIKGKLGVLFVIFLIAAAIGIVSNYILAEIPIIGPLAYMVVIVPAISFSLVSVYLKVALSEDVKIKNAFDGFENFWGAFKVTFFTGLFTFLWSLLFVIPGIIKAFSYSMAMYVLAENKDIGALEAIKKSKEMMKGHKMELFVLELSFIGWALLAALTFGIAYIWVYPYMYTTLANFYMSIKPAGEICHVVSEPIIEEVVENEN